MCFFYIYGNIHCIAGKRMPVKFAAHPALEEVKASMSSLPWQSMEINDVMSHFKVSPENGLSESEAQKRLRNNGHNLLEEKKKTSPLVIFLNQFRDFMVLVLLGATLVSGLLQEYSDAITILVIVMVNAVLGFIQEFKAERSLEALRDLTAPTARVLREGARTEIPAEELVPGDIVVLEAGDRIPADIRICEERQLSVNEAPLTGESEPVLKQSAAIAGDADALGDRYNMVFMGTMAVGGKGSGVVVATGMDTEMGRVAYLIQDAGEGDTPLQKRLAQMGKFLVIGCLLVCALVVAMGLARGLPAYKMFMAGVSLAVAAIPEGLPAVVTIALAIGVQRMVKKNAIVRKLPAVETLGCATVICSDKTGTLTQNKMNVQEIWAGGNSFKIEGDGYSPQGTFLSKGSRIKPGQIPDLLLALTVATLCNNSELHKGSVEVRPMWRGSRAEWNISGDPTEGALLVSGARAGLWRSDLERRMKRLGEIAFDGVRKRMTVIYSGESGPVAYMKGAPEEILSRCNRIYYGSEVKQLTEDMRREVLEQVETMASMALRNLASAYSPLSSGVDYNAADSVENDMIFVGLYGMMDPPRNEVLPAIKKCHTAGIKTVMITGDHRTTAVAVARMLRLLPYGGGVISGRELDLMSDSELEKVADSTYVYARVTPEHKLRIVKALKRRGHVVAMTGDGVNDAPAVKEADIGIAMGRTGTDVTREAAALILADDNFTTIVNAVEEGRSIYDNIRKFIRFLLACNAGEILTMFLAMLVGLPLPLRAIQILWINLVTDGLPAMALGVDPAEAGVMERPPRAPTEGIFARGLWQKIAARGIVIGLTTIGVFAWSLQQGMLLDEARTMAFSTLIVTQLIFVFHCRSETAGFLSMGLFSNPYLVAAVLSSFGMLLLVLYNPALAVVFGTVPLNLEHWLIVFGVSLLPNLLRGLWVMAAGMITPRVVVVRK
jgi:P-type Ca2+ transporter type 2C